MGRRAWVTSAGLVLALVACGGDGSGTTPMEDGGAPGEVARGTLLLITNGQETAAEAAFRRHPPGPGGTAGCAEVGEGACTLRTCTVPSGPASAGRIQVQSPRGALALEPGRGGAYPRQRSMQPLWTGAEDVTVTATGADVPAFTVRARPAATPLTRVAPALDARAPLDASRNEDLAIEWQTAAADGFVLLLAEGGAGTVSMTCFYPLAGGASRGVVAARLLGMIPVDELTVRVEAGERVETRGGRWTLEAFFLQEATRPGGGAAPEGTLRLTP